MPTPTYTPTPSGSSAPNNLPYSPTGYSLNPFTGNYVAGGAQASGAQGTRNEFNTNGQPTVTDFGYGNNNVSTSNPARQPAPQSVTPPVNNTRPAQNIPQTNDPLSISNPNSSNQGYNFSQQNFTPSNSPQSNTPNVDNNFSQGGGTTATQQSNFTTRENNLIDQENSEQLKRDQATTKFNQTVQGIMDGTVPLTPFEQAQVDATRASFQSVIDAQILANKNYVGGVTEAQNARGLSMYSPEMAQGNIFAAVTEANQKIADLNTKMNLTVAQMQQGFQENNYKLVKDSYDALLSNSKERTATIQSMYEKVQAQEKQAVQAQQDTQYAQATSVLIDSSIPIQDRQRKISELIASGNLSSDQITKLQGAVSKTANDELANTLASSKFTYQQKQDAIDNAFKSGQISETKRHNLAIESAQKDPTPAEKKAIEEALKNSASSIPIMQDKIQAINALKTSQGLETRVGTNILARTPAGVMGTVGKIATGVGIGGLITKDIPDKISGAGQDFAGGVHKLVSGLTLQSLIDAKARGATFGALSEGELNILANSASQLNDWELKDDKGKGLGIWNIDENSFKRELDNIQNLTRRALIQSNANIVDQQEKNTLNQLFSPKNQNTDDPSLYY